MCCDLGFVLFFGTTFVAVFFAPTVFRTMSELSTMPTFNRILVLVLSLLSLLSLALAVLAFALFALAFAKRTYVHQVVSSWISRAFLLCVPIIRVASALTNMF